MAISNARGRALGAGAGPLKDSAPRSGVIEEFDVPNDTEGDNLWAERTQDYGSIRTIGSSTFVLHSGKNGFWPPRASDCADRIAKGSALAAGRT